MHVVFRESHGLEENAVPVDLRQTPADLVVLSYSDSDLGAFAAGWKHGRATLPSLRLANLDALRHPLSVDTYIEQTLCSVRGILVRLIGGEAYWPYGLQAISQLARRKRIALAVLPADGRDDERLDSFSTIPHSTLRRLKTLCDIGGRAAAQDAIAQLALAAGLYAGPVSGDVIIPQMGFYDPERGVLKAPPAFHGRPGALVAFYRSYLTASDTAPVDAVIEALRHEGFAAYGAFVTSLKAPGVDRWLAGHIEDCKPALAVNATAFSAKGSDGRTPFDGTGLPVFQVSLSTAEREAWEKSSRGLSAVDLAMHVVLPEVDGRIFAGVVSFKSAAILDPDLQFSHLSHQPDHERVAAAVRRIRAWHELAQLPNGEKRIAVIASSYPGRPHQLAHAVGLDAVASCDEVLKRLASHGIASRDDLDTLGALQQGVIRWPIAEYRMALARLPQGLRDALQEAWGEPEDDPDVTDGQFSFHGRQAGNVIVAMQPERTDYATRDNDYHDLTRTPRHAYVAFYLWLQAQGVHAIVHMGAHGTLEWLPGKSAALSSACWPDVLIAHVPVVYPFIVNDPGEAAQAKRRIGAVTVGHLPPTLAQAAIPENLLRLERLLDEYSTADGLDPARRQRLIGDIRSEAQSAGIERDLGVAENAAPAEAIPRIDRFVCDLKESQYGDGLHIFGQGTCGEAEIQGLLTALAGRHVAPGPAGSPHRGRGDVLPTGRNLFAVDPRAVPTRAAFAQGVKLAEELLRRHLQDHGDWPKGLFVDLWGSATMRTAGEDFALALHLAGIAPAWDSGSARLNGFEIVPLVMLGRPRIDVTLRVSGLFRDVFPGLAQLFEQAAQALAAREFEGEENPYTKRIARVFGPRPGDYGVAAGAYLDVFTTEAKAAAGEAWLNASAWAIGLDGESRHDRPAIEQRLGASDAFVHTQDLAETDLLLAADYAAHEAGPAAASANLGISPPALYHLDASNPAAPRARTLTEELARVVRARAANPAWIAGMQRHGFRGGAEIAATLEHLAAFAHLANAVPPHLFDLYYDATLGDDGVRAFLQDANPQALAAMRTIFRNLHDSSLWPTRRNSIAAALEEAS